MENQFRSSCQLASVLDIIGDKWSLLIVRDMLFAHKKTFKDISASNEAIAPSVLSARLKLLESFDLISKRKLPENKKENIYLLTEKSIALTPLIIEAILWGDSHLRTFNPEMVAISSRGFDKDKAVLNSMVQKKYEEMVNETIG